MSKNKNKNWNKWESEREKRNRNRLASRHSSEHICVCVCVCLYLEMSSSISDWISMISDLVKTCGVLSSNIELSVCTKTRWVWIVKAASSSGCPPVSMDCHWFCSAFRLMSLIFFLWHVVMYLQGQEQHYDQICFLPSQYTFLWRIISHDLTWCWCYAFSMRRSAVGEDFAYLFSEKWFRVYCFWRQIEKVIWLVLIVASPYHT